MCGITGYTGGGNTCEVLLDGLSRLEYRGYDSAGISIASESGIVTVKTKGRLAMIRELLEKSDPIPGGCGIGHTRWATHGEPSDQNSHPHGTDRLTLVHNGIIENYAAIKNMLLKYGYVFRSETDTEAAVLLIDHLYMGDPLAAIRAATAMMRGSYAFCIIFADFPDRIYALRKDSPLIVARGEGENFVASDIPAILKYTNSYALLDQDEIAVVKSDGIDFYGLGNEPVSKEFLTVTWDVEAAEKGGFPHFMLKEIHENPRALRDTIAASAPGNLPHFECIDDEKLSSYSKITIVACGTAYHAGLLGKAAIEKLSGTEVEVDLASEFRYRGPIIRENELVLLITQSGETADTLAAMRLAKSLGADTLAVANVLGSSIPREADMVIYTCAGPEIAVASTKAYTVQLSVMYLLAIKLGLIKGKLTEDEAAKLTAQVKALPEAVEEALLLDDEIKHISAICQNSRDLFYIGRGLDYALAMEGSLKLKEISYIHSEAYAAGELKHGTISLVTDGVPVISLATQSALYEKMVSNIREVKSRGARIIMICGPDVEGIDALADHTIVLPKVNDMFYPVLGAAVLQLFAYHTALLRGCDVDKPRNLAKSVTVE